VRIGRQTTSEMGWFGGNMKRISRGVVSCNQCACWANLNQRDGTCRRHAPNTSDTMDEVAHWPLTHKGNQCGEGIVAASAPPPSVTCRSCVFWHAPPDGGLDPYGRRDQLSEWWKHAGHCTRFSPRPSSNPGDRAFWRVTHVTDGCFDGEARQSPHVIAAPDRA
jgi:hypothetical protein